MCVLAALEVAHLFSCHLTNWKTFVPRHPKWTIKHLVVVGVRPTVITHRTLAQGTLSSRTRPHQCAHLHPPKQATRFLT